MEYIHSLLSQGKGPTLHWFLEDVPLARLAATLVGMVNTAGGIVIVGVSPHSGQIYGVSDTNELIERVFQAALLIDPPLVLPVPRGVTVSLLDRPGDSQVVCITVPAGLPHVYNFEGRYLGREGFQTNPLPARRLRELLLERGDVQFETQIPPGASLDDLDHDKISAYIQALNLPGTASADEILLNRGCLRYPDGKLSNLRPTYAALILFGRHPQQWLPNATLLAARFSGITFGDHYIKQEISGTLADQLHQAELFMRDHLRSVVRLIGLTHQEILEYPFEAVRELLVNAIAHRDYNLQGDNIHLHLFADRLEVSSPGGLPGPVTLDNLLDARYSRNAVIVQALSDLGFIERLGYGLDRVVALARDNGLRSPRFEETAGSFRVTLFGESNPGPLPVLSHYRDMGLSTRQEQALLYLAAHRRITNGEYQDLCPNVHGETLRRDLADLVSRGVLIKVGDKRATYYILK